MIKQEIRKIWNLPMLLGVCLICVFTAVSAANAGRWDWNVQEDAVYEGYLERWEGVLTEEKMAEIERERALLNTIPAMEQDMKKAYANDEITWEEYSAYMDELFYVHNHQNSFARLESDLEYLAEEERSTGIENLQLFFTRYWNYYFQADSADYLLLFLVFAAALRSFFVETSSGMIPMLKASSEGMAGVMSAKIKAVGVTAGGIALFCSLVRLVCFLLFQEMPCGDGALQSLQMFSKVAWPVNLGTGALLVCVLKMIGFALLGMLTAAVSILLGREVIAAAVSAVCLFLPCMVQEKAVWLYQFSLYGLLNGVTTILGAGAYGSSGLTQGGIVLGTCLFWGVIVLGIGRIGIKK